MPFGDLGGPAGSTFTSTRLGQAGPRISFFPFVYDLTTHDNSMITVTSMNGFQGADIHWSSRQPGA